MAEAKEKVLREVDEAIKLLQELRADLMRIYDVLEHDLHDVLQKTPLRLVAEKDPEKREMLEKKAVQHVQRKFSQQRKYVRDAHSRAEEFVNKTTELRYVVYVYTNYQVKLDDFCDKIRPYDARLVRELSAKAGTLARALLGSAGLPLGALPVVNSAIDESLRPLLEVVDEALKFLIAERPIIEQRLIEDATFTVLLDAVTSPDTTTLLDASFARKMEDERVAKGKTLYDLRVSAPLQVPRRVWKEMSHHPLWRGQALVPKRFLDYLQKRGHAQIIVVNPTEEETEDIVYFWSETTPGRTASEREKERFPQSGDVSLLTVAYRVHEKPVIILSNDQGIAKAVKIMRRKGKARDVRVFSYAGNGVLEQTA